MCVLAAGGTIGRRRLYRASSMGYVGSLVNAQLGTAARIAALRRSAPDESPRIAPLLTAEVPIMVVEGTARRGRIGHADLAARPAVVGAAGRPGRRAR